MSRFLRAFQLCFGWPWRRTVVRTQLWVVAIRMPDGPREHWQEVCRQRNQQLADDPRITRYCGVHKFIVDALENEVVAYMDENRARCPACGAQRRDAATIVYSLLVYGFGVAA